MPYYVVSKGIDTSHCDVTTLVGRVPQMMVSLHEQWPYSTSGMIYLGGLPLTSCAHSAVTNSLRQTVGLKITVESLLSLLLPQRGGQE
jgi:hypothetical protein